MKHSCVIFIPIPVTVATIVNVVSNGFTLIGTEIDFGRGSVLINY